MTPHLSRWSRGAVIAAALAAPLGLAILLLAILPTRLAFSPGNEPRAVQLDGFYGVERNAGGTFRWAKPNAAILVPIDAPASYRVTITMADNPAVQPPRQVRVDINGVASGTVTTGPAPHSFSFDIDIPPVEWQQVDGRILRVDLATEPWQAPGDSRALGVIVTDVRVAPRPVPRPWQAAVLAPWLLLIAAAWIAARAAKIRPLATAAVLLGLLLTLGGWSLNARGTAFTLLWRPFTHPTTYLTLLCCALVFPPAWALFRRAGPARWRHRASRLRAHRFALVAGMLGALTAFYRLGAKGLWGDEVWEASWPRQQSLGATFVRFRAPPDLPLHFVLTRLSTALGEDEFWVRLPAALLGTLTVVLVFLLGRRTWGTATGLIAAALLATAPYHVWYAQEARPYAGLSCYSALSLLCFVAILRRPAAPPRAACLGFTLATTLNIANHLFGLLPLAVEMIASGGWALSVLYRARHAKAIGREHAYIALWRGLLALASGATVAATLTLPLQDGIVAYVRGGGTDLGDVPFRLTRDFATDLFGAFGFGTGWRLALLALLALIGAAAGLRHQRWFTLLLIAWLLLPPILLALAQPRHNIILRYFIFMQPIYLLLIARGIWQAALLLADALRRLLRSQPRSARRVRSLAATSLAALVLALILPTTWRGYRVEKITDWSAVCRYLHAEVAPGDRITGDGYFDGIMSWCFGAGSAAAIVRTDGQPLASIARARQITWYLAVGAAAPESRFAEAGFVAVSRTAWARSDLISPAESHRASDTFTFPQSEGPLVIYRTRREP